MARRQVLPKFVAIVCAAAATALLASHVNAWFLAPPEQGSHVQRDFVQAGFSFTPAQQAAGVLLEGLPKLAYALALVIMVPLLWSPDANAAVVKRVLSRSSALLLTGAVLLIVYPVPASVIFSLLEPGDAGLFLLSLQPVVIVTVLGSLLFAATVSRMRAYLQERQA